MYYSYVWQAPGLPSSTATELFIRILEGQRELYRSAWGLTVELRVFRQDDIHIGQIYHDPGVIGWRSWVEQGSRGLVWNGICETHLEQAPTIGVVHDVLNNIMEYPDRILEWDGNYFVVAWDGSRKIVTLTTGATECPTLWFTQGPNGWAAGSRGAPILEMVGNDRVVSPAATSIYLAYGYDYSDASLFENVSRFPQRSQIVLEHGRPPKLGRYVSLAEYINSAAGDQNPEMVLPAYADRLVTRVRRQLQYSSNPEILVTGGRDSRCVAAAAKRADYMGVLSTGGHPRHPDSVIGEKVAHYLELSHKQTQDRVTMQQFSGAVERLKSWSRMSEGIEVLRHVRAYNAFVAGKSLGSPRHQLFHGLGGEIARGYYYKNLPDLAVLKSDDYAIGRKLLLDGASPDVTLGDAALSLLNTRWDDFSADCSSGNLSVAQWLDLFFWQNSVLRWGADMLSAKTPMYWAWTPLIDRKLICAQLSLDLEYKRSNRFSEDLSRFLSSKLQGLNYDVMTTGAENQGPLSERWFASPVNKLKRGIMFFRRHTQPRSAEVQDLTQFWEKVLLSDINPVWADAIDKNLLRRLIYKQPNSELLWNAATVQSVVDAYREQ